MSAKATSPRVLLRGEQSDGHVSVIETAPGPGAGPPLHHHGFDEAFYVIEGELTFQLHDERFTVGAAELAFAPRGVPHKFANPSDAPARELIVCTPAGFERYFARMAAERQGTEPPEWAMQPIPEVTRVGPAINRGADPGPANGRPGRRALGREPTFHAPCFVVAHRPAETIIKKGGTSYIFVTDGIEAALHRAQEAAGSQDVLVNGGADRSSYKQVTRPIRNREAPVTEPHLTCAPWTSFT